MNRRSISIDISGTVQGVGFRPFVFRMAQKHSITGKVWNSARGVSIIAQGLPDNIEAFVRSLQTSLPPLARISRMNVAPQDTFLETDAFSIEESSQGEKPLVDVTRDTAPCVACAAELFDQSNRRYRHPFINCTDCGPRFTIIKTLPYDRVSTTMADFAMCPACEGEYNDPADRRFHAQPVCCNVCGPRVALLDKNGASVQSADPVGDAVGLLAEGHILAVKGLGGFHLACRADSDEAVRRLRAKKGREEKPFALMVRNADAARRYAVLSQQELSLLESIERPIVLVNKKNGIPLSLSVAPGLSTLGLMLPYTPIHHLLFDTDRFDILIMTSANYTDEPLCRDNEEAVRRLVGIADAFLVHDRDIHIRIDDSIARMLGNEPVLLRRARGYVPAPLPADFWVDGIVGLGGIMKSTVTVGRGSTAYVSQYLGTADTLQILDNIEFTLNHMISILGIMPTRYVCDLHPGGLAAHTADASVPLLKVQHHHAHAVACMAENRVQEKAICIVYDGMGLGDDGTIWGGEFLLADRKSYLRIGHCALLPMPGGDAATLFPGRMALAALYQHDRSLLDTACTWMDFAERSAVLALLKSDVPMPLTSSMGRLFDACAALLDVNRKQTYEGQPAIELEGIASSEESGSYESSVIFDLKQRYIINGPEILACALRDYTAGTHPSKVAARFHNTIADCTAFIAREAAAKYTSSAVCLSGGCFQNRLLFERTVSRLVESGLQPVVHRVLSPGDECVSFGQVIIAAQQESR